VLLQIILQQISIILSAGCVKFHKNSISSLVGVALSRYMPPLFGKVEVELSPLLNFGQQPYSFMHICRF
jgi:hypothetical protein